MREARMRPEGLGALPARSSGLRCRAEAAAEALPPEVPLLAGIKNWRHAEDLDPAGDQAIRGGPRAWRPGSGLPSDPGPGGARAGLQQNLDCELSSGGQHLGAIGYPGSRSYMVDLRPWLERFERLRERGRDGAGPTAGVQSP
ncbi:hypothetical protein NDU88_005283 [Pleurodeles waltl]|uniref:Uncharacterized protein n=1 Tax=Pleurodeles waltl TaxID=8319 RepID=A0AAV7NLY0_PLEWA|nr:hypothetical protein NDU88_005283 [Pleurodeles waltl]